MTHLGNAQQITWTGVPVALTRSSPDQPRFRPNLMGNGSVPATGVAGDYSDRAATTKKTSHVKVAPPFAVNLATTRTSSPSRCGRRIHD
jgi:hypothetical protein